MIRPGYDLDDIKVKGRHLKGQPVFILQYH